MNRCPGEHRRGQIAEAASPGNRPKQGPIHAAIGPPGPRQAQNERSLGRRPLQEGCVAGPLRRQATIVLPPGLQAGLELPQSRRSKS
jgi:hypothetical protein